MRRGLGAGAALLIGGVLGWAAGLYSRDRIAGPDLPLMQVAAAPPGRLDTPAEAGPPAAAQTSPEPTVTGASNSVRATIERALPHATADERDIWYEQLKDLPPGIVEDLLHVRKQFRELSPSLTPSITPAPLRSPPATISAPSSSLPAETAWSPSAAALRNLREVALHNLANADTPGFRRREPLVFADGTGHGVRWQGTRLDLQPGPRRRTLRPADVAIEGLGWFAVGTGDVVRLTRRGSFVVRDGVVALPVDVDQIEPVWPRIVVPEHVQRIEIAANGEVGGWSPDSATPIALGQLELALPADAAFADWEAGRPVAKSAMSFVRPGTEGTAALVTLALEQSNVNVEQELERLRWIDEWLQRVDAP